MVLTLLGFNAEAQSASTLEELFGQIRPQTHALMLCFHVRAKADALATCEPSLAVVERVLQECKSEEAAHRAAVVRIGGSDRYGDLADRMVAQAKGELRTAMRELVDRARIEASSCQN